MASRKGFFGFNTPRRQQSFILEPILTPSGFIDGGDDTPDPVDLEITTPLDHQFDISVDDGEVTNSEDLATHPEELPQNVADDDLEEISFVTDLDLGKDVIDETEEFVGEGLETPDTSDELTDTPDPVNTALEDNLTDTQPLETQDLDHVVQVTEESNILENQDSEISFNLADTQTEETAINPDSQVDQTDNSPSELDIDQVDTTSLDQSNSSEELSPESPTETLDKTPLEETETSENLLIQNETEPQTQLEVNNQQIESKSELEPDTQTVSNVDQQSTTEITPTEQIDAESEVDGVDAIATSTPNFEFDSGVFTVGENGEVGIDYLFDGGKYKGQLAIFSLEGMEQFEPGSSEFIQEAASRALSNSELGHIVISDATEGARFSGQLSNEVDWNQGEYVGVKTFNMQAGDQFAIMLVPNGKVAQVFNNPDAGGALRPLFSLATANPEDGFNVGQIADVTGDGNTFVMEDLRVDGNTDKDYNDIIFQVRGATGKAIHLDEVINPAKDWRTSDLGEGLIAYAKPYITPEDPLPELEKDLTSLLDELDDLLIDDPDFEVDLVDAYDSELEQIEPEVIVNETTPELEPNPEVIVSENNPESELTEPEVIVNETTPELEPKPEAIVSENNPELELTEPEVIVNETTPELEPNPEVIVSENTLELELTEPEVIVNETTPELEPKPEVIVSENNPELKLTEPEVIVNETTPELEHETEVIVSENNPELKLTEPEVIVNETTPELEHETEVIVSENNPESELTETEVIVSENNPESELTEPEVIVNETTPELEPNPEVIVSENNPESELTEPEVIVNETTPELEHETEVIVSENTPELKLTEPEVIVNETTPELEHETEVIVSENNPESELTETEVIVSENNPESELIEPEVIVDETTPELEPNPEVIVSENNPESELTEPEVIVDETTPELEPKPEAIVSENNPESELTEPEVIVNETTPELEPKPEAIVSENNPELELTEPEVIVDETTPELEPNPEVIVSENNPESELTEPEVIVNETTPELEHETEVIVSENTPELKLTEPEVIVNETTPELEHETEVIVSENNPELKLTEPEVIVNETTPELEHETEVIVSENTLDLEPTELEVIVAETNPKSGTKPEVIVAETTPELETEVIVAENTPELETEVIVTENTSESETEPEVIVAEKNQDLIEETELILIGGEQNDALIEVETPESPTETVNNPEEISSDDNPIVPLNITENNIQTTEIKITPIVPQEPNNPLVDRLENLTQQLRHQTLSEQPVNEALITRLEQLTTQLQNKPSTSLSSTALQLIEKLEAKLGTQPPIPTQVEPHIEFEFATEKQPLVGIIDTGFSENNPDIDYTQITWGSDKVDGDANPTLSAGEGNEHGTHVLGIIAAQQNNGIGIDGINDNAPIWAGRAIGSGKWAESLVEFVDAAKASGQPNAVVNLSLDLTQINPDGSVTTRYELTPQEEAAIAYAQKHNIIVVVSAGDNPGTMSALGQLSKEFDNLITVGATQRVNDAVAVPKAYAPASYSGSGDTLDIVADGNSGSISSTTVATAKVTGTISQVWAANPDLNYTQVIDIIKRTATDLAQPNWDSKTGAGLLNIAAAITLAKATEPELYTVKPGQRTITDNFISQNPTNKPLPGDPTHPAATPPGVPQTAVDTGGNSVAEAVQLLPSGTQDIIDQVSPIDPTDTYRLDSRYLQGTEFSVLSGELSVSYLTPSGEVLATQVFGKGSHQLQLPANATDEIILKIDRRNDSPATYMLYGFESTATEPFNIGLEFDSPLTTSQQQIMEAVAKSVASLIGKGLPSAVVDGKVIDDINIKISTANLDGLGGTQARTKIDFMRYGTLLPAQSLVQFDANDIAELERSGQLFSVVQHEFLHALGFGNLWEAKGLVDYAGTPLAQYNGASAVEAFQELGGLTDAITLESEGDGSASLHWHEMLFQDEIMTADLNGEATGNAPISTVTLASLADLGYEVNLAGATSDYSLFGGDSFNPDDLTPEQIAAFRELAETSFEQSGVEYIAPIMPTVDPDKVAPEIWAHAERFWKNGEYYDWVPYAVQWGDTLSQIALDTMGSAHPDYYWWIANHNGIPNPDYIVASDGKRKEWIDIPQHHPNYEWEQEQERLRREAELRQRQEEEARIRREQEEAFAREQERIRQEEEARRREAEAKQRELEEQERRLREEMERRRQEEERRLEEARLAELARQAAIAEQQGKGGLDWFVAKPLPEFGPVDPFETRLTGETVGNLVPDDYYRFTLSRNGRITAELRQLLADADLVLYDVRNRPIAYSMREGITDEQIIADLIPGTYMLRVNSPKGVTTDYELIVKFKHLLSRTEQGPPDGWRVGGGDTGGGGGGVGGPLFADPRIQNIYNTALANFAEPERAKANAKIAQFEAEKRSYEQQMQALLDQMNAEQRAKVHQALDNARNQANVWADNIANPIKNTVDNLANGIINKANSFANDLENKVNNIPDFGWGWIKDRKNEAKWFIQQGRDAVTSAVNSGRSSLKGKLTEIQNGVKSAIWHFFETIKNAYRTGAEINQIIANAAQTFRNTVNQAVQGANNLIAQFKGQVLSAAGWTKNLGFHFNQFGINVNFDVYNNLVQPAVNAVADGFQSTISGIGSGLKGIVDWIEPRTQKTVADIVNALLGDKTGYLWNQIHGVDAKIAATRTSLEKVIQDKGNLYKRLLDDFVNGLGSAKNFVVGALMGEFNNDPSIWQVLLDSAIGMIPIAGEIGDVRDLIAYSKKFIDNPSEMQDPWNWVGVVGSLIGLVPVAGGAIKGVTKVARNADFLTEIRKLGPAIVDAVVNFVKRTDWTSLVAKSKNFYIKILDTVEGLLRSLNNGIRSFDNLLPKLGILQPEYAGIGKLPDEGFFADIVNKVSQLRRESPKKIDEGFAFLKGKLDDLVKIGSGLRLPYGFKSAEQFQEFGTTLYSGFSKAGYNDVEAIVQGSAATGIKFETRLPITSPSDFDLAIVSSSLFDKAEASGVKVWGATNQQRILLDDDYYIKLLGLDQVKKTLTNITEGIPSNFMIFKSREDAIIRAESSAEMIGIDPKTANIFVPNK